MQSALLTLILSFLIMMVAGPVCIPILQKWKFGQTVRTEGPQTHLKKQGTLTMGGLIMLIALVISALAFSVGSKSFQLMLVSLLFVLAFSAVGFLDDYIKVVKKRSLGLKAWQKIVFQFVLSLALALYCYFHENIGSSIIVPFVNIEWDLGIWYIPFSMFVTIAVVNSANLTDGVDGLLSSVTTVTTVTFMLIALFMKAAGVNAAVTDTTMVLCAAMSGACLGFLRYNAHPAKIFMGDIGSFQLGAVVTVAALVLRLPLVLPMAVITYLLSALSDIIQIGSYKIRHKRVFRMAPLHHHFELGGISEPKIVAMYTAVTVLFCILTLLSLGL